MTRSAALLTFCVSVSIADYASAALITYIPFDEAASGTTAALDQADSNNGTFAGAATRTSGLIGLGAASFNNTAGAGVNLGAGTGNNFSTTTGISVEAIFDTSWNGVGYDEIFRKEDGGNRILLAFQTDAFSTAPAAANQPVLGFGLFVNNTVVSGYSELDLQLGTDYDGVGPLPTAPTLAALQTGTHHVVATYDSTSRNKRIYIDGVLYAQRTLTGGTGLITSGGAVAAVIGNLSAGTEPFSGVIDEFAFYNSALTPAEITAHYQNVLNGVNYFVPEPSSLSMLIVGTIALWITRRR